MIFKEDRRNGDITRTYVQGVCIKPVDYIIPLFIYRYTFRNSRNVTVRVINYGCVITDILVPDKNGTIDDISIGYDKIEGEYSLSPSLSLSIME